MGCPACGGTIRVDLGGGRFHCRSQVVKNAVPPGQGGNAGPAAIPIYGDCGHTYTLDDERRADSARVAAAEQHRRENERLFEFQELDRSPDTPKRIATLAAELIDTRPGATRPLVIPVDIPSLIPLRRPRQGYAEVYRVWPIGSFDYWWKDGSFTAEMGVTRQGIVVALTNYVPTVTLTSTMRWFDPADHPPDIKNHQWRVTVLRKLEMDLSTPPSASDTVRPEPQLQGRALSYSALLRGERVQNKISATSHEILRLTNLYGTRVKPAQQGRPSGNARLAWSRIERLERKNEQRNQRLDAAGFVNRAKQRNVGHQ